MGFRFWDLWFRVWDLWFRFWDLRFRVWDLRSMHACIAPRVFIPQVPQHKVCEERLDFSGSPGLMCTAKLKSFSPWGF